MLHGAVAFELNLRKGCRSSQEQEGGRRQYSRWGSVECHVPRAKKVKDAFNSMWSLHIEPSTCTLKERFSLAPSGL